jgi:diacylglycerol kinase
MSTPSPLPQKNGMAKFIAGFGYAFQGLWYSLRTQINMRVHIAIALLAIALGIVLRISSVEFAVIFLAIASVLIVEMLNTVIELCVDLASPAYHPLAKSAKDVAAGAVLVSAIFAVIIAFFIFGPHLWALVAK